MNKLLIVDGNAILHRAYHAIPPLNTGSGEPINAVHGMVSMLLRLVDGLKPTHIVFAFDRKEPTFRKKEFEGYQSQRPPTEDNLSSQFEKAKEVLEVMNICFFDKAGFEADDIIGTLAKQATEDTKILGYKDIRKKIKKSDRNISISQYPNHPMFDEVVIVTGDKDQLQLVTDKVKVFMPVSGISTGKIFGEREVVEKMGVTPSQIIDYKGLVGDPSDNYPGVFGIGPKTAINLLQRYITLKQIYKNINEIEPRIRERLEKSKKEGDMSYHLATIVTDVPFDFDFSDMNKWNLGSSGVIKLFRRFGFRSLTQRVVNYDLPAGPLRNEASKAGLRLKNTEESGIKDKTNYKKNLNKEEIEMVVLEIAKRLKGKKYAIRGTASLVLQGLNMGANDIDIVCDKKTALEVNKLFKDKLVSPVNYSESDKFKSYFGKFEIDSISVEVMGEWQIKKQDSGIKDNDLWSEIYSADKNQVTEIKIQDTEISVTKLEIELKMSAEMGRWNEFHKMKKLLQEKNQQKLF